MTVSHVEIARVHNVLVKEILLEQSFERAFTFPPRVFKCHDRSRGHTDTFDNIDKTVFVDEGLHSLFNQSTHLPDMGEHCGFPKLCNGCFRRRKRETLATIGHRKENMFGALHNIPSSHNSRKRHTIRHRLAKTRQVGSYAKIFLRAADTPSKSGNDLIEDKERPFFMREIFCFLKKIVLRLLRVHWLHNDRRDLALEALKKRFKRGKVVVIE